MRTEKKILSHFINWASANELIRAAILTSSRVNESAKIDFLSDYDIELYVSEIDSFLLNDEWLEPFGEIMVKWPYKPKTTVDENWLTRLILFKDGVRIDFQITAQKSVETQRYLNGYKVLIDKDNITLDLPEPTYMEFNINSPTREEFEELVSEFWWEAYYVPKYLWRDELPFAKYILDSSMRFDYLHKVMDWYICSKHNWQIETGALGKKYKALLSTEAWQEYELTFAGSDIEENWQAFFRFIKLFSRLAQELSKVLGYDYPHQVEEEVTRFCEIIRKKSH